MSASQELVVVWTGALSGPSRGYLFVEPERPRPTPALRTRGHYSGFGPDRFDVIAQRVKDTTYRQAAHEFGVSVGVIQAVMQRTGARKRLAAQNQQEHTT